jgi:hypothetical protein
MPDEWISEEHRDRSDLRNLRRLLARILEQTRSSAPGGFVAEIDATTHGHMVYLVESARLRQTAQIDGTGCAP